MPSFKDSRKERFSVLCATGMSTTDAHAEAGFKRNPGNARSMRSQPAVAARIAELEAEIAERAVNAGAEVAERIAYGREDAMREAGAALAAAMTDGKISAAVAAIRLRAELSRLLVQQHEHGAAGEFGAMDADQLRSWIAREAAALGVGDASAQAAGGAGGSRGKPH